MCRPGTAARSRPRATWCSRARPTAASSPTTPRPARSCGRRRPAPASLPRAATYKVDGKQYVSVAVGWGGVYGVTVRATEHNGPGTVYTFAVGRQGATADFAKYQRKAAVGREVRSGRRRSGHAALRLATACSATACPASTAAATSATSPMSDADRSPTSSHSCSATPTSRAACRTSPASSATTRS